MKKKLFFIVIILAIICLIIFYKLNDNKIIGRYKDISLREDNVILLTAINEYEYVKTHDKPNKTEFYEFNKNEIKRFMVYSDLVKSKKIQLSKNEKDTINNYADQVIQSKDNEFNAVCRSYNYVPDKDKIIEYYEIMTSVGKINQSDENKKVANKALAVSQILLPVNDSKDLIKANAKATIIQQRLMDKEPLLDIAKEYNVQVNPRYFSDVADIDNDNIKKIIEDMWNKPKGYISPIIEIYNGDKLEGVTFFRIDEENSLEIVDRLNKHYSEDQEFENFKSYIDQEIIKTELNDVFMSKLRR